MKHGLVYQKKDWNTELRLDPFEWHEIKWFFSHETMNKLKQEFPQTGFSETVRAEGSDKTYKIEMRKLSIRGSNQLNAPGELSALWQEVGRYFLSDSYRRNVEKVTNLDLSSAAIEIIFNRYSPGCWLSPHTDSEQKIVTQLLYFNESWSRDWGGYLELLRSSKTGDVASIVLPTLETSVLFARSEQSWHAVKRVSEGVHSNRLTLQVIFWKTRFESHRTGRIERKLG